MAKYWNINPDASILVAFVEDWVNRELADALTEYMKDCDLQLKANGVVILSCDDPPIKVETSLDKMTHLMMAEEETGWNIGEVLEYEQTLLAEAAALEACAKKIRAVVALCEKNINAEQRTVALDVAKNA